MQKKRCTRCGKLLPLDKFLESSFSPDGHTNKCITCTRRDSLQSDSRFIYTGEKPRKRPKKERNPPEPTTTPPGWLMPRLRSISATEEEVLKRDEWIAAHRAKERRD